MCGKHTIIVLIIFVSLGWCIPRKSSSFKKEKFHQGNGRSAIRKICPSKVKLNCLSVMYSKPCNFNKDCSYVGPRMLCCQTGCSGNSKFMCVPERNSKCPYLQPAYYSGMRKCRVEADCAKAFTCCLNIAGEGYCHKPTLSELIAKKKSNLSLEMQKTR